MSLTILNIGYPLAPVTPGTAGGAEQILSLLDDAIFDAGHQSMVIAPEGSECRGILFTTGSPRPPFDFNESALAWSRTRDAMQHVLDRFSIDVVHMHGVDFYRYLPQQDVPLLVTLHLPLSWYPAETLGNLGMSTHLLCVSRSQLGSCPPGIAISHVIENGVPLGEFHPVTKRDYVVSLGRICPEKGFHLAFDAASQAKVSLFLAGTVFPYATHQQYWEKEIKPRLAPPHCFLGALDRERKRKLLASARCLVISSLVEETSSLVAMESLACGTPVVALRRGALPEVVDHGLTGFLVDAPEQLPEAIVAARQLSPQACRRRAEALFSAERMTSRYLSLYQSLATKHRLTLSSSELSRRVA